MFKELIDKLKQSKKVLQAAFLSNKNIKNEPNEEQSNFEIIISRENNIFKIEISDYISLNDYDKKIKSSDEFQVSDLICNCVLWNSSKQKVNKGTYYVISIANRLYNILFTDDKIKIDERTKIKFDEQTSNENIIQERVITFDINNSEYHYFSAKHYYNGDTFYTRYYNKNRKYSLGKLDLSAEVTYAEINSVICNLEYIEGIKNILDIEMLKTKILEDLGKTLPQTKKSFEAENLQNVNEIPLINRLEKGISTKILLISHNSFWPSLQRFKRRYKNFEIEVFGSGTSYIKIRNENIDDCDFIIYYSSRFYDEDEFMELKDIAFRISNNKNKRVSIGYSYVVPIEERKNKDISEEIKIVSFSNNNEYEETTFGIQETTILDLTDSVVIIHEELENQIKHKRTNKKN